MVERLLAFFKPKPAPVCVGCLGLDRAIKILNQQVEDLRSQRDMLNETLFRVTRITKPEVRELRKVEPTQSRQGSTSWRDVRQNLEEKHKRKSADAVQEYWKDKSAKLEAEARFKQMLSDEA